MKLRTARRWKDLSPKVHVVPQRNNRRLKADFHLHSKNHRQPAGWVEVISIHFKRDDMAVCCHVMQHTASSAIDGSSSN